MSNITINIDTRIKISVLTTTQDMTMDGWAHIPKPEKEHDVVELAQKNSIAEITFNSNNNLISLSFVISETKELNHIWDINGKTISFVPGIVTKDCQTAFIYKPTANFLKFLYAINDSDVINGIIFYIKNSNHGAQEAKKDATLMSLVLGGNL